MYGKARHKVQFWGIQPAANFEVELWVDIVYSLLISWSMWLVAARVKI